MAKREGRQVHLLTRREAGTHHYRELLASSAHQLRATLPVAPEVWIEKLSVSTIKTCLAEAKLLQMAGCTLDRAIFFTGWKLPILPRLAVESLEPNGGPPPGAVLRQIGHAPAFWLKANHAGPGADPLRSWAKQWAARMARKRLGALQLLLLDQRVLDSSLLRQLCAHLRDRFAWIPDPAPVPRQYCSGEREASGWPTVLVVGQRRKGLIYVVKSIERHAQDLPVRFHFV